MNRFIVRAKFYALIIIALFFVASGEWKGSRAYAQHEGHNMPGMNKPKPAPAKKKPTPQKKTEPTAAAPKKDDGHNTHKMSAPPAPNVSPDSSATPLPGETKKETAMPSASPAPSPSASPAATTTDAQPAASQTHGAPHQHNMSNVRLPSEKATATDAKDSMKNMDGKTAGVNSANTNSVMVMAGEQMSIRVGSSASNFLPMSQMGSGTSWQPSTTPMHMWHKRAGDWMLMFHGEAKLGVNSQGGPRGVTKFESMNWFMPMAFRRVGQGTLALRGMFSLEPFTLAKGGTPQLFQVGETFRGRPLVDAQHPHDLFMELSATYTMPLGERGTWFTYFGFPGEPALGPVAFMHRASASENPTAPLTHHLQDSTHITFGVLTTGFTYRWLKLEGSLFNGHEPDEERYDFEFKPWNSRSVRLSIAPNQNWSAQVSYGRLKNPEILEPGETRRLTASIHYNKPFARGNWATSFIWGRNRELPLGEDPQTLNGYTAESTLNFLDKNYVYTRLELVDRDHLLNHDEAHDLGIESEEPLFRIGAYTFGAARDVWNTEKFSIAIGGDFTFYSKPDVLDQVYGRNPTSYKLFVRIRPGKMRTDGHGGH